MHTTPMSVMTRGKYVEKIRCTYIGTIIDYKMSSYVCLITLTILYQKSVPSRLYKMVPSKMAKYF